MDEYGGIQELIDFLYAIISGGCVIKLISLQIERIKSNINAEEDTAVKKRMLNTVEFFILSLSIVGLIDLLTSYIGG